MIESFLFAGLGFLVAAGFAMAIAPTLWRRAERLERKRIEASLPLSRPEQEAEIGAVRAASAMLVRRLEIKLKALVQKNAGLKVECDSLHRRLLELGEKNDILSVREEEIRDLKARLVDVTQRLADQKSEFRALSRLNDEYDMTISTQKIDLVASEAEIERLNNGLTLLRTQRREADRAVRVEKDELANTLKIEQIGEKGLQSATDRPLAEGSTREHSRDMQTSQQGERQRLAPDATSAFTTARFIADGLVSESEADMSGFQALKPTEDSILSAELRQRIADLTATYSKRSTRKSPAAQQREQALREEISSLGAQMLLMVADREGPRSAINKALAEPVRTVAGGRAGSRPESLSDRVQTLRKMENGSNRATTDAAQSRRLQPR